MYSKLFKKSTAILLATLLLFGNSTYAMNNSETSLETSGEILEETTLETSKETSAEEIVESEKETTVETSKETLVETVKEETVSEKAVQKSTLSLPTKEETIKATNQAEWVSTAEGYKFKDENGNFIVDSYAFAPILDDKANEIGKEWKYFDQKGISQDAMIEIDGYSYYTYAGPNKSYHKGWKEIDGQTYFFRLHSGSMVTNWQYIDGKSYYFRESGTLTEGWQYIENHWYYITKAEGRITSKYVWVPVLNEDGDILKYNWKFFNSRGWSMDQFYNESGYRYLTQEGPFTEYAKGWKTLGDYEFFFRLNSGSMVTNWQYIDGKAYYFRESGSLALKWQAIGGFWYYIDREKGKLTNGFQELVGPYGGSLNKYWFRPSGTLALGFQWIPTGSYYVNDNGQGRCAYFDIKTGMAKGWQKIDGSIYYFDPIFGFRYEGVSAAGNNGLYNFDKSTGKLLVGRVYNKKNGFANKALYLTGPSNEELSNSYLKVSNLAQRVKGQQLANYGLKFDGLPFNWFGHKLSNGRGVYCSGGIYDMYKSVGISIPGPRSGNLPGNYSASTRYNIDVVNNLSQYRLGYQMVNDQYARKDGKINFSGNYWNLNTGDVFFSYSPNFAGNHRDTNWANHSAIFLGRNNGINYTVHSTLAGGWVVENINIQTNTWGYRYRMDARRWY